ncbi:restriction endonuclease subunit S [Desulfonema magnum]|uniref:Restriction modification system methylase, HsdS family n=1 Tax=Desulfonema magnum TaxID=45655 RepID=A0A975BUF4_9BACT|nr:restriction endonuclease subunit S [Desulfonema magnum]QTA91838.1 Restriction modification system methylase, HsdS family [Desulfonema magnum]
MNIRLKPYKKYKDSGVEWLGKIPTYWQPTKIKHLFKERSQKGYPQEPLLAATQTKGVVPKEMYENRTVVAVNDLQNLKLVEKGDFVISLRSFQGGIEIAHYRGIISPAYTIMIPKKMVDGQYFKFLFKSKGLIENLNIYVTGIRQGQNIDYSKFRNSIMPLPPVSEQKVIADFLNRKTEQANTFIEKQTRVIELLEEQKKAIINKAVTKGLNPDAPMKDSGVEWLGEIPAHWEVRKLKFIGKIVLGKMLCSNDLGGYHYKHYLKSKNIGWINVIATNIDKMWFSNHELKLYKVEKGDLLLSEGGEVGKTCIWENEIEECYIQNSVHKVTIDKNNYNKFYLYYFYSIGHTGVFKAIVNQVSIAHLTREKLKEIECIVPTKEEQQQIVTHIETQAAKIDQAIDKAEKEITLVKEYLQSLIYHVVTGRVKIIDN